MTRFVRPLAQPWAPGSFLASLVPDTRQRLLAIGVPRQFEAGRLLLREGDENSHVELLLRGFVKVTTVTEGVETLLSIRVPGDILGETAALTGGPRTATVTACGRITSMVISQAAFRGFLRRHPDAALKMGATLGERLHWANQRRADFAASPAKVRLARVLAEMARKCGRQTAEGITIAVRLSQPELASMIGVAEATAQKAIRELREGGQIRTGYRQITIVDLDALRATAMSTDQ